MLQEALQSAMAGSGAIQADWPPNFGEEDPVGSIPPVEDPGQAHNMTTSSISSGDGIAVPQHGAPNMAEDAMSLPDSSALHDQPAPASSRGSEAGAAENIHAQSVEDSVKQEMLEDLLAKGSKMIPEDAAKRQAAEEEAARVAAAEALTAETNTARAGLPECIQRLMQLTHTAAEVGLDAASAFLPTPTDGPSAAGTAVIELVQQNLGSLLLMVDLQEQAGNLAVAIGMLSLVRLPAQFCHTL